MLTIILGILKVIGILLLVVLCILLLAVLLLLFCPVRYRGLAEKEEDQKAEARVDVTWLMHLLHITVAVKDAGPVISFRILGISSESLGRLRDRFRRREKSAEKKTAEKKNAEKPPEKSPEKPVEIPADKPADCPKEDKDTSAVGKANREDSSEKKIRHRIRTLGNRIEAFLKKIMYIPARLQDSAERGILIGRQTKEKLSSLKDFVSAQEFREALFLAIKKAMQLIRHILPGWLSGKVVFGLQDPADTGMVLAVIAPFFPLYGERVQVIPDFQEKRLAFSLIFRGRIYGWMLLCVVLRLLLDRNVQVIIRKIRKKEV